MSVPTKEIYGWGRVPVVRAEEREAEDLEAASADASLSRGLGRSYGDASLPARGPALCTRRADRILSFDPDTGVLRAEAGLSLRALNEIFPARGWATPVSPGTQYVTLGTTSRAASASMSARCACASGTAACSRSTTPPSPSCFARRSAEWDSRVTCSRWRSSSSGSRATGSGAATSA
ncbi:MAG: FAD-dependent oxidoreductase [Deltaproteobacteria bacterium]|nr:MAG: FAD-dependent oxidoreductase [Deltaproteobacteria bacterium]